MSDICYRSVQGSDHINCDNDLLSVEQVENVIELQLFNVINIRKGPSDNNLFSNYTYTPIYTWINMKVDTVCVCVYVC